MANNDFVARIRNQLEGTRLHIAHKTKNVMLIVTATDYIRLRTSKK